MDRWAPSKKSMNQKAHALNGNGATGMELAIPAIWGLGWAVLL